MSQFAKRAIEILSSSPVTREQIRRIRDEASMEGDHGRVRICDLALSESDPRAIEECQRIIEGGPAAYDDMGGTDAREHTCGRCGRTYLGLDCPKCDY